MSLLFFLRPAKTSDAGPAPQPDFGGHFGEEPKRPIKESKLFVLRPSVKEEEIEERLPELEELESPPSIEVPISQLDQDTRELLFEQAKLDVLKQELELLQLEDKLRLLTEAMLRQIEQFEEDMLLLMIASDI